MYDVTKLKKNIVELNIRKFDESSNAIPFDCYIIIFNPLTISDQAKSLSQ